MNETETELDPTDTKRGISVCSQNGGYHAYMAGPCFDKREQAVAYRNSLDRDGVTWRLQS